MSIETVLPATDTHFQQYAKRGYYQRTTYIAAKKYIKQFRTAVDIGAHVGFWTRDMCTDFDLVWAFEPDPTNFACLAQNVPNNAVLMRAAIGDRRGAVTLTNPKETNSGAWEATPGGPVPMVSIDDTMNEIIDFVKIDVQGYELPALKGMSFTLKVSQPVVVVEVKGRNKETGESFRDTRGPDFLKSLGAEVLEECGKDWIMGWR